MASSQLKTLLLIAAVSVCLEPTEGVRQAKTALRFRQLLKVAMNQKKEENVDATAQPYGPWTSKNFSMEAIKQSPCAQDGKSSAFDKFKQDKGPSTNTSNETLLQRSWPKAAVQKKGLALVKVEDTCAAKQQGARALIQEKLAVFGVQCEDMCKEMGVYPKCQCPGFAGQPASSDDNRACIAKNCQDPTSPCPNDAFMTCVHETTKVSVLQWDSLMQKFDSTMDLYKKSLADAKKATAIKCPAPLFVAEGQYCVCKDPENCPSTVETMTPEEAAKLAAEAHTWNQSGAPGTR